MPRAISIQNIEKPCFLSFNGEDIIFNGCIVGVIVLQFTINFFYFCSNLLPVHWWEAISTISIDFSSKQCLNLLSEVVATTCYLAFRL